MSVTDLPFPDPYKKLISAGVSALLNIASLSIPALTNDPLLTKASNPPLHTYPGTDTPKD